MNSSRLATQGITHSVLIGSNAKLDAAIGFDSEDKARSFFTSIEYLIRPGKESSIVTLYSEIENRVLEIIHFNDKTNDTTVSAESKD